MHTLWVILFVIFVLDAFLLVIAVLLQSGRGGGLAGALGGIGSPDSALGVRAASQIEKATGIMAVIFFATALALSFVSTRQTRLAETPETTGREAAAGDELTGETSLGTATTQLETGAGETPPPAQASTQAASTTPPAKTTEAAKPGSPESATSPPAGTKE